MFSFPNFQLRTEMFAIFGFCIFIHLFGAAFAAVSADKCTPGSTHDEKNRDAVYPRFPLREDPRHKTSNILKAHEIIRNGLQQFLEFREEDLGFYLNHIVENKPTLKDEYGKVITTYWKVFQFIWEQYNETLCQNYAIKQFENDKLDLCSVARFLSHQPNVENRGIIMKILGDALGYKCHPCTPYKRMQYGRNVVPNTDHISSEGVPLEERLVLCTDYNHQGKFIGVSSTEPTSTTSSSTLSTATEVPGITTTVESIRPTNSPVSSSGDYSPCSHSNGKVVCDQISLEEVRKVFNQTSSLRLASVELILQPDTWSETFIPEDLFGKKRIRQIEIDYPYDATVSRLLTWEVDPNAFRSTKSYTTSFTIIHIDCNLFDLEFLSGFEILTTLTLLNIVNIQNCLPKLPPLPQLIELDISYCSGIDKLNTFPNLINGLKEFKFFGELDNIDTIYNDKTVDRIIDWLLLSSTNTLEEIIIADMNQVTRVPPKIASFKALRKLRLTENNISTIKYRAFSFSVPVAELDIEASGVKEIEPGAFQGDFKNAEVLISNNSLTRFEESVFGSMLQQMASGGGFIRANTDNGNPIDCSKENICHLAWLRRYKSGVNFHLNCANGTSFDDLQPAGFNHCPSMMGTSRPKHQRQRLPKPQRH